MKKNILKKASVGIALGLALLPFLVLTPAQVQGVTTPNLPTDVTVPTLNTVDILIQKILNFVAGIVLAVSIIMLLWAAILFMTAGTSETVHTKAKNVLIYAIIGTVVAILAYAVKPFLINLFGGFI